MPERGNLSFVEALGEPGGLRFGGGVWVERVAGDVGIGGGGGGFGEVSATGEESGEEASEAQGGNFEEIAFGA